MGGQRGFQAGKRSGPRSGSTSIGQSIRPGTLPSASHPDSHASKSRAAVTAFGGSSLLLGVGQDELAAWVGRWKGQRPVQGQVFGLVRCSPGVLTIRVRLDLVL